MAKSSLEKWKQLTFHAICLTFPEMNDDDFAKVIARCLRRGASEVIWLFEGQVLDGRHMLRACWKLEIKPKFKNFQGTFEEAVQFALDQNDSRRHNTSSQRAMVAAELAKLPAHRPNKSDPGAGLSQDEAGKRVGVSGRQVRRAKKVKENGTVRLIKAVVNGKLDLKTAEKVAKKKKKEQNEILDLFDKGRDDKAKELIGGEEKPPEPEDDSVNGVMDRTNYEIESFCRTIMNIVFESLPDDSWLRYHGRRDGVIQKFKDACESLRNAKCSKICPICNGEKTVENRRCEPCIGTGRMPKPIYDQAV
jgi:hypothetical protein